MAFKLFALFALVAAASASPVGYGAPLLKAVEVDAHPQYHFAYAVHDEHTGDQKTQEESRDGDVVRGSYSLIEADGSRRVVEYTADDHNGFNAVVHREAGVAKAIVAAPVVAKYAAPLAYHAAPVYRPAPVYRAAPVVAKYAAPLAYHAAPAYASVAHGSYGKATFSSPHATYAY